MIKAREYRVAETLEEAWELNQKRPNRIVGGNMWLRLGKGQVGVLIDISKLGLDKIEETEEAFVIGAMVTLRQLEEHPGFGSYTCGAIRDAVSHIIGVQFRNLATVGGSIHGRFGFSDVLTLFLAMDTKVELYKGGLIPLEDYAKMSRDRDILVSIHVKKENALFAYNSVRSNATTDFPVLTGAMAQIISEGAKSVKDANAVNCEAAENGKHVNYRCVIGARPARAVRMEVVEVVNGQANTEEAAEKLATAVKAEVVTGSNLRGSAEYRKHLSAVVTRRMMKALRERNASGNAEDAMREEGGEQA